MTGEKHKRSAENATSLLMKREKKKEWQRNPVIREDSGPRRSKTTALPGALSVFTYESGRARLGVSGAR